MVCGRRCSTLSYDIESNSPLISSGLLTSCAEMINTCLTQLVTD